MQPFAAVVVILFFLCLIGYFGVIPALISFLVLAAFVADCLYQAVLSSKSNRSRE